ncbi:hypothetical protein BGZ76_008985 [Entomortierella beljakovae]|nr:hypothetical protein BGZ76_008985 [Entomortierella beljakovae]
MQQPEMIQTSAGAQHTEEDDYTYKAGGGTMIGGIPTSQQRRASRNRKLIIAGTVVFTISIVGALAAIFITKPWDHKNTNHTSAENKTSNGGSHSTQKGGHHNQQQQQQNPPTNTNQNQNQNQASNATTVIDRFTMSSSVSISNSVQCNTFTPSLDQPFLYGQQPIRGVNLGGWLVLEPFITPSMFDPYISQGVIDEYSLTKFLGPEKAREALKEHYATWVTEDTFKRIRDLGLNHVRIPVGFWALGDLEADEPYVADLALDYLLQGLKWAAQYGIRVMVELHAAPGSQNGWNHSGRSGKIRWLNGTPEGEKNAARTIAYTKKFLTLLQGPGMEHVSPLYGILNEPAIFMLERERVDSWYGEAFATMRNITGAAQGPWGILHDGFLGLQSWEGYMPQADRLALDVHQYLIFDHNLIRLSKEDQTNFSCDVWSKNLQRSTLKFGPTVVGEFSSATNDCATYLNGVGVGYRWDGTFRTEDEIEDGTPADEAACQPAKNGHIDGYCSCASQNDVNYYTPEYRKFLSDFTQTQMDAFEQGIGWFYWNFKTETNALWSYFDGVDQGWIPKDANSRTGGCAAIGRPITPLTEEEL